MVGPATCNGSGGADSAESSATQWQIDASWSRGWSHLHFDNDWEPTLTQQFLSLRASHFFSNGVQLTLGGGAILSGQFYDDNPSMDVNPGWLATGAVAWRIVDEKKYVPFLSTSLAFTYSRSSTQEEGGRSRVMWASDVRFGVTVGYTLFDFWQIYLAPRVFGGPVFVYVNNEKTQGRDRYFFQAGMGTSFLLPAGIAVFVSGSPLGEQNISAGAALSF